MNRSTIETIVRGLLTAVGTFLIGKNLLGSPIDDVIWEMVAGCVMSGVGIIWGVVDKSLSIEMLQSFIRSTIVGFGGLLVAKGTITPEKLESYLGIALALLTIVYSITSKAKSAQIAGNKLDVEALKQ